MQQLCFRLPWHCWELPALHFRLLLSQFHHSCHLPSQHLLRPRPGLVFILPRRRHVPCWLHLLQRLHLPRWHLAPSLCPLHSRLLRCQRGPVCLFNLPCQLQFGGGLHGCPPVQLQLWLLQGHQPVLCALPSRLRVQRQQPDGGLSHRVLQQHPIHLLYGLCAGEVSELLWPRQLPGLSCRHHCE